MEKEHFNLLFALISCLCIGTGITVLPLFENKSGLETFQESVTDAVDETVSVGDPPFNSTSNLGYELLDNGSVFHMWNNHNSYYFNRSSGVQFSNHYQEFWTTNVLMLGYYAGDHWNLLYRTDELSGFTEVLDCVTEDYINVTLWKDLSYGSYDFRLALRYHLKVNDSDLTIIPYIKNLGSAIPFDIGFGWEMKDINIANVVNDNYLWIGNNTIHEKILLNQTLDNTWNDLENNTRINLVCTEPPSPFMSRNLYLRWNKSLNYKVICKSRSGQINAPTTLFIKVGTLDVDQEKFIKMFWLDADDWLGISSTNYVSHCGDSIGNTLLEALDGTDQWYHYVKHIHHFILDLGETYTIKKFKGRSQTTRDPTDIDIYVSDDTENWGVAVVTEISTWANTDAFVEAESTDKDGRYIKVMINACEDDGAAGRICWGGSSPNTIFDAYGDVGGGGNTAPTIAGEIPVNTSTGIGLTPVCNVTANDADGGDTLTVTFYENTSGSYVLQQKNTSVSPGTSVEWDDYAEAKTASTKYWWKVHVDDATDNVSEIYHFTTASNATWQNLSYGYLTGGNVSSYTNLSYGYLTGGNISTFVNLTYGYLTGGNVSSFENLSYGYLLGGNTSSYVNLSYGYLTGGNSTSFTNLSYGYLTGGNTTGRTWHNLTYGYLTGGNITSFQNLSYGYLTGGNTTSRAWVNTSYGYLTGGNVSSYTNLSYGYLTGGNTTSYINLSYGYLSGGNSTGFTNISYGYLLGGNITSHTNISYGYLTGGNSSSYINLSYGYLTGGNITTNLAPQFSNEDPTDGHVIYVTSYNWSMTITDETMFNWTLECSDGQNSSGTNDTNGTFYLNLSSLATYTTYTVWVNASDGYTSANASYIFTVWPPSVSSGGGGRVPAEIEEDVVVEPQEPTGQDLLAYSGAILITIFLLFLYKRKKKRGDKK